MWPRFADDEASRSRDCRQRFKCRLEYRIALAAARARERGDLTGRLPPPPRCRNRLIEIY